MGAECTPEPAPRVVVVCVWIDCMERSLGTNLGLWNFWTGIMSLKWGFPPFCAKITLIRKYSDTCVPAVRVQTVQCLGRWYFYYNTNTARSQVAFFSYNHQHNLSRTICWIEPSQDVSSKDVSSCLSHHYYISYRRLPFSRVYRYALQLTMSLVQICLGQCQRPAPVGFQQAHHPPFQE